MAGYVMSALAAASLVTAGLAATGSVRSADALPAILLADGVSGASTCSVKIIRTGTPGAASIVRDQLADGRCTCVVTTGAASLNSAAEGLVNSVLRDRECTGAPTSEAAANETAANASAGQTAGSQAAGAAAGAGAGAGAAGALLPIVLGGGAAGGLAVSLGNVSNG